ncbi:hypothetical protein ACQEVZ_27950 [Dactylosporangium sp. CA-152071]|uniref:hypothetical protein n=1 Tax=Dactylosporangium sp. CA-152071 TaxID=3239933 RepID=UPI003D94395F
MGTATAAEAARIVLIRAGTPIDASADVVDDVTVLLNGYVALAGRDPATQLPDATLIETAMRYARTAAPAADEFLDATVWARYAYHAARTLHGVHHPRTVEATEALIWVLYSRGLDSEACTLQRQLVQLHLDHGNTAAHLTARVALAGQLHGAGRCAAAVQEATAGWNAWIDKFGAQDPAGLTLVLQLVGLLAGCQRIAEAQQHIQQAYQLLPESVDPTRTHASALIHILAMAPARHRSVCTAPHGREQPDAGRLADLIAVWTELLP